MRWIYNLAGGGAAALIVTSVWWMASQPHRAPVEELRDLYASPLCLTAAGVPQSGSPTIGQAWVRVMGRPTAAARPLYHGGRSIQLRFEGVAGEIGVSFVRVGAHTWRPARDTATDVWTAQACRRH